MDLDGLEQLMKANHKATINAIKGLNEDFKEQRTFCDGRFDKIEDDVGDHGKVIAKSKGIITILGAIWAAVTTVAALVAPYFWR
jgi:hypothetical protein